MTKKTSSTKTTKETVKTVLKTVADPKVVMATRNKYRSGPKLPKARVGGGAGTGRS